MHAQEILEDRLIAADMAGALLVNNLRVPIAAETAAHMVSHDETAVERLRSCREFFLTIRTAGEDGDALTSFAAKYEGIRRSLPRQRYESMRRSVRADETAEASNFLNRIWRRTAPVLHLAWAVYGEVAKLRKERQLREDVLLLELVYDPSWVPRALNTAETIAWTLVHSQNQGEVIARAFKRWRTGPAFMVRANADPGSAQT
jgi:hypothetical protein